MSIRWRLTLLYTFVLTLVLCLFGLAVYVITRETLLNEIDDRLRNVAELVGNRTEAIFLHNVPFPSVPEDLDVFDAATIFMTVVDTQGKLLDASSNLGDFNHMLDPEGFRQGNHVGTVKVYDRPLRVLSLPLSISGPKGQQIIGYLQVASLMDSFEISMKRLKLILLLTGLAAVTLSLLLGAILTHRSLEPLDVISGVAMQITKADDLGRRLPDSGRRDEIGQLTNALNLTLERLERVFVTQQRFLADVSHELRTPLTALRGNVDLMRRMGGGRDTESLDAMQEELERMSRLVGDLLFLARADSGGLPIRREPVDLDTVLLDVFHQGQRLTDAVRLELVAVEQVRVLGDGDRLKQVLLNLVDNAIKYTPAGGTVSLTLSQENGQARVEVADTGVGIPAEDLPRIFDRFYRVDKARSRALGGAGLGLSIAHWIVRAHGGDLQARSSLGKGTVFTMSLPVVQIEEKAVPAPSKAESRPRFRAMAGIGGIGNEG